MLSSTHKKFRCPNTVYATTHAHTQTHTQKASSLHEDTSDSMMKS